MPVSSSVSRRAVASGFSPSAISPFGSAQTPGFLPPGRIAANTHSPRRRLIATPPAENSRRIESL